MSSDFAHLLFQNLVQKQIWPVVLNLKRDDAAPMIKKTISAYDIERLALFVIEDIQSSDSDLPELIGMYLENVPFSAVA